MIKTWWQAVPGIHFHYSTKTPELGAKFYIDGIEKYYPSGSWDFRPVGFANFFETLNGTNSRYRRLAKMVGRFPHRRFILLGDTSNPDTMRDYPKLMKEFPDQVQCILLRDTQETEAADWRTPSTRHMIGLPLHKYYFFSRPSDLRNISTGHLNMLASFPPTEMYGLDRPLDEFKTGEGAILNPRLNQSYADDDPSYKPIDRLLINEGCFPPEFSPFTDKVPIDLINKKNLFHAAKPHEARKLSKSRFTGITSVLRMVWWRVRCDFIKGRQSDKLRQHCRYDLRAGGNWTEHGDGKGWWDQDKMEYIRSYQPKEKHEHHHRHHPYQEHNQKQSESA
ncbi:hypothetical protein BDZ85DRAFT_321996 [Elsinoe ampelina]|uniref:Phosphatidate phosphatase APP1 catalytic domain-containing protein n=1 Tax=Elsinoe ampelina TaxID=302913 RepID=A0A6A6G2V0_9PEZI|nr:hypothetical protein BDZ85DRAFT_321996 [Elsinoe ampelina]